MEPNAQKAEKERNSRERIYLIVIFAQLICIGVLIWQLIDRGQTVDTLGEQNVQLEVDKGLIEQELDQLELDFDNLQTDNIDMQDSIAAQRGRIEQFRAELAAAEGDKEKMQRIINKLRKETETLRRIMKHYVVTIDSLNTLNVALRSDLADRDEQLGQANEVIGDLSDRTDELAEKVKLGAKLETEQLRCIPIRLRSGGGQAETKRAKNTDMINTKFSVRANTLAKAGERDFYVRIIKPDGNVLRPADTDTHFEWIDGKGYYTIKHAENYSKEPLEVSIYYDVEGEMQEGKYMAEIYSDGLKIGTTYFSLK